LFGIAVWAGDEDAGGLWEGGGVKEVVMLKGGVEEDQELDLEPDLEPDLDLEMDLADGLEEEG
jgi:hypothetical protein